MKNGVLTHILRELEQMSTTVLLASTVGTVPVLRTRIRSDPVLFYRIQIND